MLGFIHFASVRMPGPKQKLRFLAKRLLHGPSPRDDFGPKPNMMVLLATPIYVALDD